MLVGRICLWLTAASVQVQKSLLCKINYNRVFMSCNLKIRRLTQLILSVQADKRTDKYNLISVFHNQKLFGKFTIDNSSFSEVIETDLDSC